MNQGILNYAPIFWFHEYENYFPIDVKAIIENADLYHDGEKVSFGRKVEELVGLVKNGEDFWLELAEIDFQLSVKNDKKIQSKKGFGLTYTADILLPIKNEV